MAPRLENQRAQVTSLCGLSAWNLGPTSFTAPVCFHFRLVTPSPTLVWLARGGLFPLLTLDPTGRSPILGRIPTFLAHSAAGESDLVSSPSWAGQPRSSRTRAKDGAGRSSLTPIYLLSRMKSERTRATSLHTSMDELIPLFLIRDG